MGSILGSKGNKSSNSSGTTPGFTEYLNDTLAQRQKSLGGYGKRQAIEDVNGVLQDQAKSAMAAVMPSIAGTQINAGAYNTTTKELLRNDATAQVQAKLMETQLNAIKDYAAIEQGDINAFSNATKANTTISSSGSSKGGGSGLLGLFADGGKVPETESSSTGNVIADLVSKIQAAIPDQPKDSKSLDEQIIQKILDSQSDGFTQGLMKGAAQTVQTVDNTASALDNFITDSALSLIGFSEGGKVPEKEKEKEKSAVDRLKEMFPNNIFDKTREKQKKAAGLDGYADGGKVPTGITPGKVADHTQLLEAIRHHANGGVVRSGEDDVQAGGKIQGPETQSGEDNQVIAVGGGEGIIAADVMKVPGVEELVNMLNDQFHTPT